MKSKLLPLFLALTMSTSLVACGGSSSNNSSNADNSDSVVNSNADTSGTATTTSSKNELIIGSTADANADMLTGWTNLSPNKQVKTLIHGGADTVVYTEEGVFMPNMSTLAKDIETIDNADGSKTFIMSIKEDLVFNDGSPITAHDYVFQVLLESSPEFGSLDADNFTRNNLVGFEEFNSGESKTFSGVKLLGDYEFSLTVSADNLPYYFDLTLVSVAPKPMVVIAPGVTLSDDGNGATLSAEFTNELLQETINDPVNGYRYKPLVTSGPYQFVSYDPSSNQVIIEINPNFCGTYRGQQPSIERLIFKSVVTSTQFDELESGSVGLLSGISGGTNINRGLDIVDDEKAGYTSYPRAGYGKVAFACNFGPTQFQSVRHAIGYTLDREEFAKEYTGGFGKLTHGYYGLSQWEYQKNEEILNETLTQYTKNLELAEQILIDDGWTLNSNGGEYVKGTDAVRYKEVDGELMGLEIEWANTPDNPVSDLLARMLPDAFAEIGMKLNPTTVEFAILVENLQQTGGIQQFHMFNLSIGFATTSSVWYYFNKDLDTYGGAYNQSFIADDELHDIAQSMKIIEPGDTDTWSEKWLELQIRWNELLPELPLFSDEYHEFFTPELENYTPNALWSADYAIVYANIK